MSTLLQAVMGGGDPLAGVKRPLSAPTSLGQEQTQFRGAPMSPPNEQLKVPKLESGNRQDRGTNVTVPYARVTALTTINQSKGRLSPGDVLFLRKTPAGYLRGAPVGTKLRFANSTDVDGVLTDPIGIDGINIMLTGTLDGSREWEFDVNLLKRTLAQKEMQLKLSDLKVLKDFVLDGVIISNDEPYSFTGGQRDSAVLNVAIGGPAKTNNGYLSYETHSPTELYPRGKDPLGWQTGVRIGLEKSGDTWHSMIGGGRAALPGYRTSGSTGTEDFIAAFTNSFTMYPTQMFDRKVKMSDRVYVALREYNLYYDVVQPRANKIKENEDVVLRRMRFKGGDVPTAEETKELYFYQWMPCTSTAFQKYVHNESKNVNTKVLPGHSQFKKIESVDVPYSRANDALIGDTEYDAVRDKDVAAFVGAWLVGTVTDASSDRAGAFAGGPVSTAYRMTVNVCVKWVPRNYDIDIGALTRKDAFADSNAAVDSMFESIRDRVRTNPTVPRAFMQSTTVRTLAKMEFHETPHYYDGSPIPPAQLAANAKVDYEDAKLKLNDAGGAYVAARNQGNLVAFKQAVVEVVAAAAAYKATAVDAAQSALADDAVADAQDAADTAAQLAAQLAAQAAADAAAQAAAREGYETAKKKFNDAEKVYLAAQNQGNLDAFKQAADDEVVAAAAYKTAAVEVFERTAADNAIRGAADDKSKAYTAADAPPTGTAAPPPGTAPIISSASAVARGRTQPRAAGTMPSIVDAAIASRIAGQASSSLQQPMQPTHHPTTTSSPAVRPTRTASKATAPRATTAPSACGGASSGGIVDKVFSSMFGESACSPPASAASSGAAAAAASASAAGVVSTPPSPTHPSSGESGPRVFQRRQR